MRSVINNISNEFIAEAKASPRMLEDLALMEKYMSESYDGRTFVELIQNADDANSNRIRVDYFGETLFVANDGRPFDINDIMAICRSGSSNKQRGVNIGYRGVGFKSATTISSEIIIYSSGVFFSFSKSKCAKELGMPIDKVPTVRIPYLFNEEELDEEERVKIEEMELDGFTTFFIFRNAKIEKFKEELAGFNSGWLLFLRKLSNVDIELPEYSLNCKVARKKSENGVFVKIIGTKEQWYVTGNDDVSLAFKYDDKNGIEACSSEDAVFHCFLPTMDKTGYPFKINADFSTDPSRKHIIADDITMKSLERIANAFVDLLIDISNNKDDKKIGLLSLLNIRLSLSDMSSKFENQLNDSLYKRKWVLNNNEDLLLAKDVRYLPNWLEESEKETISEVYPRIGQILYNSKFYIGVEKIEKIISKYGAIEIGLDECRELVNSLSSAKSIGEKISSKIFVHCCRGSFSNKERMGKIYIPTLTGYSKLSDVKEIDEINPIFIAILLDSLNASEISTLTANFPVLKKMQKQKKQIPTAKAVKISNEQKNLAINKWKTPVQNCLAVEALEGRTGKDVSKKSSEYNIESVDSFGNVNYIVVKQVKSIGDSFVLSEEEYDAAARLGEFYKIFLISMEEESVEYLYIDNPSKILDFEKIVKRWEFKCNKYSIPDNIRKEEESSVCDKIMNSFLI